MTSPSGVHHDRADRYVGQRLLALLQRERHQPRTLAQQGRASQELRSPRGTGCRSQALRRSPRASPPGRGRRRRTSAPRSIALIPRSAMIARSPAGTCSSSSSASGMSSSSTTCRASGHSVAAVTSEISNLARPPSTRTQDEEVLVDRDHPQYARLARVPPQRRHHRGQVRFSAQHQRCDGPDPVLGVSGDREVEIGGHRPSRGIRHRFIVADSRRTREVSPISTRYQKTFPTPPPAVMRYPTNGQRSVMVRRSPHRFTELPDPRSAWCDPVPEGACLLELA